MLRFGLSLVSGVYSKEREAIVTRSLNSLYRTNVKDLNVPVLAVSYNAISYFSYEKFFKLLENKFDLMDRRDPPNIVGAMALAVDTATRLLEYKQDVTHLVFLWDDFVYNPEWLQELYKLIQRHPDSKAWSIYRSRYSRHHQVVGGDGIDVLMSMHDGIGCVTREEWIEYGKYHNGSDFSVPLDWPGGGNTPDIHHAYARPGNRWATSRDYAENLGRHIGIEHVDCAIDFVGE